jgi:hypothetical protein
MKKYVLILALAGFLLTHCVKDEPKDTGNGSEIVLYINELASKGEPEDWFEIYNPGEKSLDIGGFFVYDDPNEKYQLPVGTTIDADGFLVVYCDDQGEGLHTSFKLSSDGETLSLEDKDEQLIDEVEFPALEDGESYGRVTDGEENWMIFDAPTKGLSNEADVNIAPVFDHFTITQNPGSGDTVLVSVEVTDDESVSAVSLYYKVGKETTGIGMQSDGDTYSGKIPAFERGTEVSYYIAAVDTDNDTSFYPPEAPATMSSYTVGAGPVKLFINEFMASNDNTIQDDAEEYEDWIEIYNGGTDPVDIGGMYVTDDLGELNMYQIPTTDAKATTIEPGGFLLLWADKDTEQGVLHVGIKLSGDGEAIGLVDSDGATVLDSLSFGAQTTDVSYGRIQDGGETWTTFDTPTPGKSN